ncbi:MAG: PrgI family protein [Candidatus Levyibacteriota bacterium]
MDGHPIPQDITGFQFKLIGDMTIKQFAYVAFGAVVAWILYSLPLPSLIKLPLSALFALLGAGFAFLPISGRPMDVMAYNFVKALFAPSQYIYQKSGGQLYAQVQQSQPASQATGFMAVSEKPKNEEDKKEMVFFSSLFHDGQNAPQRVPHIITQVVVGDGKSESNPQVGEESLEEKEKEQGEYLEKEEQYIEKELEQAKTQEAAAVNTPSALEMHQKVLELEKILQETVAQRQELERQLLGLQQKLNAYPQNTFAPSPAVPKKETRNVRSIPAGMARSTGVPMTPEFPNLLTGIIKDPRGNPLPSILVEVKDKDGNPVRAFKTNGLGQFASATALANGVYNVVFEDPRGQNKFDVVEITASGEVILPLEVISQDPREELRKSLFSAQDGS